MTMSPAPDSAGAARDRTSPGPIARPAWWRWVLAGSVALVLGLGSMRVFTLLGRPIALLLLAITLAAAVAPLVQRRPERIPRVVASLGVYALALGVVVGIGWLVVPPLVDQSQDFVDQIPDLVDSAQLWLHRWDQISQGSIIDTLAQQLGSAGSSLVSLPLRIFSSLFDFLLVLVLSIYILIEGPDLLDFALSLFPDRQRDSAREVFQAMGRAMGGYIRGTLINSALVGLITYLGLMLIGVEFPLVLGLISGIAEIVPIAGPVIASIIILFIVILQSPELALIVLVFLIVMQQLENNLLVPKIMERQADISPLLVLVALFIGNTLGGPLGAIVAIPVAAALSVLVTRVLAPAIRHWGGATPDG